MSGTRFLALLAILAAPGRVPRPGRSAARTGLAIGNPVV